MSMASGLGIASLVYAGGLATRGGGLSPGDWYLFMQAVGFYWWPLINIASFWSQFQDGLSAAERAFALIDAKPKVAQAAAEPVDRLDGQIQFCNLQFTYTGSEVVLPDFSLDIRPRETLALVGHTGAGKSSIARLIGRFYEFQEGELQVDGRDIRRLDLQQYRRQIGVVPQEPFLFSGTVRDNIRYGRPEASDEEVEAAARAAQADDFIAGMSQKYESHVEARGTNFSGGQKQRLAIARALLVRPSILILDDSTSSVDVETETRIQDELEKQQYRHTSFVVAQRISTVLKADKIVVLDRGRIVAEGTHKELMQSSPIYREIFDSQLGSGVRLEEAVPLPIGRQIK
jgi:ATP-binding cassette subfamily B protein